MTRTKLTFGALLAAYVLGYLAFRMLNVETWAKDGRDYVIFPIGAGKALYYVWRPLSYIDGMVTGVGTHIGPHAE